MSQILSERRLAENEAYFRDRNEQVEKQLGLLKDIATEEGKQHLIHDEGDTLFHFYCECSDENCQSRIALTLTDYVSIHKKRDQFTILPRHDVPSIEEIIHKQPEYWIVKKMISVPKSSSHLNVTPIQNT